jgi:hypothetical protein
MTEAPKDCSKVSCANDHRDLIEALSPNASDSILLHLAMGTMKMAGHRYGSFLDAATTAAKLAVYSTYLEQGRNLRKTGFLHHVEPKRVKAIAREIEAFLADGKFLKTLGTREPYYLIGLPHLWQEKFPWQPGQPRIYQDHLTEGERQQLEATLAPNLPLARLVNSYELAELIEELHQSQGNPSESNSAPLSEALGEHIKFRLIHAGTVFQLDSPLLIDPLYGLALETYSPQDSQQRALTMIDDVAEFFRLMQGWVEAVPQVMRAVEVFDVDPARKDDALKELDQLLLKWADRYHVEGGEPMVMHLAAGPRTEMP